jgi:hypothetical protein
MVQNSPFFPSSVSSILLVRYAIAKAEKERKNVARNEVEIMLPTNVDK